MHFTLIGLSDAPQPVLSPALTDLIQKVRIFAGAQRHYDHMASLLPEGAQWLMIRVPLDDFLTQLAQCKEKVVVFASGDPLFFGIGNTLRTHFPKARMDHFPVCNALQMLAGRLQVNLGLYRTLSLTGRPWQLFDQALINGESHLALLTDKSKTPVSIAQRMCQYGYDNYVMQIGECLGGPQERITSAPVTDIKGRTFQHPNCLLLQMTDRRRTAKGVPDQLFNHLDGRPKMITKMPVRLTTLALMALHQRSVLWDVGSCTGSMAIEARLQAPHLQVTAFEIRPESADLIPANCQQLGAPGIELIMGDFRETAHGGLPAPDALFIGGYGGEMEAVLDHAHHFLQAGGIMAFNAVSEKSQTAFLKWAGQNHYNILHNTKLMADQHNAITILVIQKK
jgi:precorrin-6B C5,15-methyltransferase / cobalt-precorrin-6B C5,C15-methyltransferase